MNKCEVCERPLEMETEYGDQNELYCPRCEEIEEKVKSELRKLPEEQLKRMAACWCPLPRRLWLGESISDAQVREYVTMLVSREQRRI